MEVRGIYLPHPQTKLLDRALSKTHALIDNLSLQFMNIVALDSNNGVDPLNEKYVGSAS